MATGNSGYDIVISSLIRFRVSSKIMYRYFKRATDIVVATLLLVLSAPFLLLIAFLIKLDTMGPVIFRQKRYGKDKQPFWCYKFRSMAADAPHDRPTAELKDADMHITSVGAILRRSGLDERSFTTTLPELSRHLF